MNEDIIVDNLMFMFITDVENFDTIIQSDFRKQKSLLSPSKIPQSPVKRTGDTPKLRSSNMTDSSALQSMTSSHMRIPSLIQTMNAKITKYGKIYLFKMVPQKILQYENIVLQSILNCEDMDVQLQISYQDKINLQVEFKEYFQHIITNTTKTQLSAAELFTEEVLGLPHMISSAVMKLLPLNPSNEDLSKLYDKVKNFHPEQRLYELFPMNFQSVLELCASVIGTHPEYAFVQPQIYADSLARATAARIFYDADFTGKWQLTFDQYKKTGYSVLKQIFQVQNTADISTLDSPFGYEQFYVMYCLYSKYAPGNNVEKPLAEIQLRAFNEFQYSARFVARVFRGVGRPLLTKNQFNFEDFIVMLLSDVCYDTEQSCRFMFNVADISAQNSISKFDFDYFFSENQIQFEQRGVTTQRQDILIQLQDMIKFNYDEDFNFSFEQIRRSKMHMNLFDAMFSVQKFVQFENRDPYVANSELQTGNVVSHCDSGVWRAFWQGMYDSISGDD
ncbi:Serine/threonine-protein_phosphatase 2A [Hexamita inflata]|uniref:Serine/threonine-protein phosphatase 2A n=1 Tax=Hexamita inflata TaxID=28002 RepID=A0AA86QGY6_9EUKA|nr:Serine/threonine-protein phosphatase 2A [Hexamita inflata]